MIRLRTLLIRSTRTLLIRCQKCRTETVKENNAAVWQEIRFGMPYRSFHMPFVSIHSSMFLFPFAFSIPNGYMLNGCAEFRAEHARHVPFAVIIIFNNKKLNSIIV